MPFLDCRRTSSSGSSLSVAADVTIWPRRHRTTPRRSPTIHLHDGMLSRPPLLPDSNTNTSISAATRAAAVVSRSYCHWTTHSITTVEQMNNELGMMSSLTGHVNDLSRRSIPPINPTAATKLSLLAHNCIRAIHFTCCSLYVFSSLTFL